MARPSFRGAAVPDGLLYDTASDTWLRREDGDVVIGATAFGIFLAGEVIASPASRRAPRWNARAAWARWSAPRPCLPCMPGFLHAAGSQ